LHRKKPDISLDEYARQVAPTDRLATGDLRPVLLGLYGEVGSIMATAKKLHREGSDFTGYRVATVEEFGDALWYFAALCRRRRDSLHGIFSKAGPSGGYRTARVAGSTLAMLPKIDPALLRLGQATAALLSLKQDVNSSNTLLTEFARSYLKGLHATGIPLHEVVAFNILKTRGRFIRADQNLLPTFDEDFDEEERIPDKFEIEVTQRKSGKTYLRWNGVFIGDPLTDNILDPDGYRFHDVFHFANAAILHWSPTFRALIKHKRKSDPIVDEAQDGGRAIVVEEGLTAWIFSRAKDLGFFARSEHISFDVLKTIQQFTAGYEVEQCPLSLWEDAILQGYAVFRRLRAREGGIIICNRNERTIAYKPVRRKG
jgi:hypothetical protein